MKKKINNLLDKLEDLSKNSDQISPVTEPYALQIKGGKLEVTTNGTCGGSNNECNNHSCEGSSNQICNNACD
jgi:hypothetical protein